MGRSYEPERLTVTIPGQPIGKERPRLNTKTGRVYTPQRTRDYEARIAAAWKEAYPEQEPSEDSAKTPYRLYVEAYFQIPKGVNQSDRERMINRDIFPGKKPDLDNICKAAMDGLNGVAYVDDAQIVSIMSYKVYSEEPRLVLTLQEVI